MRMTLYTKRPKNVFCWFLWTSTLTPTYTKPGAFLGWCFPNTPSNPAIRNGATASPVPWWSRWVADARWSPRNVAPPGDWALGRATSVASYTTSLLLAAKLVWATKQLMVSGLELFGFCVLWPSLFGVNFVASPCLYHWPAWPNPKYL